MAFWMERPTLVTGATGLMGSWLLKKLLKEQAQVIVLLRDGVPRSLAVEEHLLDRVITVRGAVEDFHLLRRTLSEYNVDTIFHLAAQPLVGVAKADPLSTLETNVRGTWNVLEAARLCLSKQIVVASSDKAYGPAVELPYVESHPLQGRFPYDVSKSCADLISAMYAATYRVPVCILRCANLFGGGDWNFSRTIPGVIAATLKGERFIIRSDGQFVRDFLYVKDAAEAYVLVAERLAEDRGLIGEAFNFGMELPLTVLTVVQKILSLMDRTDLEPVIMNQASAEIREQHLSTEKARTMLGWAPRYDLISSLTETIAWYRHRLDFPALGENTILAANTM